MNRIKLFQRCSICVLVRQFQYFPMLEIADQELKNLSNTLIKLFAVLSLFRPKNQANKAFKSDSESEYKI